MLGAAPTIPPEVKQLVEEVSRRLDLANFLLIAVGVIAAFLGLFLAVAALAGAAAARSYVEKRAEAVAERVHSAPIARVLNSVALLEWQRIKGYGTSRDDVLFLAKRALELLESADQPDPDLLADIKNNLAYYYVDFERKEDAELALRYSQEVLDRFPKVQGEENRRRALQWLDTFAFVHSRLLTCDEIKSTKLRQTIQKWMELHEPIREQLAEHLTVIDKRCPEVTPDTATRHIS